MLLTPEFTKFEYIYLKPYVMGKSKKSSKDHKSDQMNSNDGTNGTNKVYDYKEGNRGKQLNPNKKE